MSLMAWTRLRRLAFQSTLIRCRVLASKIGNELRNKRPEHFVDKLSLADVYASLEMATFRSLPLRRRQDSASNAHLSLAFAHVDMARAGPYYRGGGG
jgi:hypothetical protein